MLETVDVGATAVTEPCASTLVSAGKVIVAVSENDAGGIADAVARATAGLARYKQPRACLTVEKIPRSLQGKVQRSRVRELVLARYAMTDGPYPRFEIRGSSS